MSNYLQGDQPKGDKYERQWEALGAWFLGPLGENKDVLKEMLSLCVDSHAAFREDIYPTDPQYITEEFKSSTAYRQEIEQLREELIKVNTDLSKVVPFFAWRYQGHMNWDTSMPANIGYLAGLLYNQNNVAAEGGPITTLMEIEVATQLCKMLGYNIEANKDNIVSWGHITCGGTVANIEAMWAARNLKFHPLAVKKALAEEPELKGMSKFSVQVPGAGKKKPVVGLSEWELFNLSLDDVISMTNRLADESGIDLQTVSALIKKYNIETLVAITPASNHYSWPKSMTLLGLGDSNLLHSGVDVTGRQDIDSLEVMLNDCLKKKIPVIAVVSVMGTTEEGAIDPIDDIFKLKQKFEKKGLTFSLHADAAWGGYMCSMLTTDKKKKTFIGKAYVASSQMNDYSRNGSMRNFVTLTAPVVFRGDSDPNIGVYGIEGSKPGAAAVSCLLSHRVIGMDVNGYGRVMSQCISGAKLFYCMWLVVAQFIRQNMLGKSFEEMMKEKKVADFISGIGGDAMVNPFLVNIKGNTDVELANRLSMGIYNKLSYTNAIIRDNRKVPMIITQSEKGKSIGVENMRKLKAQMGLDTSNDDIPISFLINTVLNPFLVSFEMVQMIASSLRDAALLTIGEIQDSPHNHGFISMGTITDDGLILGDHLPVFTETVHQYHAIAKFRFLEEDAIEKFRAKQNELKRIPQASTSVLSKMKNACKEQLDKFQKKKSTKTFQDQRVPVIFGNPNAMKLPELINSNRRPIEMDCFAGLPSDTNGPFMTTKALVEEVVRFTHFDMTLKEYPDNLQYLLFGDENGTYLSHIMTMRPDMHQVVELDKAPAGVDPRLIRDGILITIPSLPGAPMELDGEMVDPLQNTQYTFEYIGKYGKKMRSSFSIGGDQAKIWTDFRELNVEHNHGDEMPDNNEETGVVDEKELGDKIDTNVDKYMKKSKTFYGLKKKGYDAYAPVQPGDIISVKGYNNLRLKVDLIMPDEQVVGILDSKNEKVKGFIKYRDVILVSPGNFQIPFELTE